MREHNEFCDEINRRKEKLIQKKKQKKRIITTCISMAVCLSVVAAVPWNLLTQPKVGDDENEQSSSEGHIEETENGTTAPLYGVVGDKVEGDSTEGVTGAPNGSQEGSFDFIPSGQPTYTETKADKTEAASNDAFENGGVEDAVKPEVVETKPAADGTQYESSTFGEESDVIETELAPEMPEEEDSYYEFTSTFVEDTRIDVETTFDVATELDPPIEFPDIEFPVETNPTDTEAVTYDIAYIMISDAAGNIIREGEVKNYEAFVIYLKLSEAELLYEYHVSPPPESLPDTTAPYDTVADEAITEETFYAIWADSVAEGSFANETEIAFDAEWPNFEEGFDTADEIWIEITECDSMDIVEESTVPDETHGFVSDETNISARERVIIIEIANDNDKWVFSCDKSDYEAIGPNLESLFELYEVNRNESESAPTQATHTECDHCGEVGVEHERWFIAVVMSNGMIMPEGQGCFESVSAMDVGIWLHYSAVDGDEERILQEGDLIRVTYNGMIMESYPVQINASKVEILK